ncbi:MAG: bpX6 domain-containing protein [Pseudomonadota bacterium]
MTHNIWQPLFKGRCAVKAIWFDTAQAGEAQARRLVLAQWRNGARLFQMERGYLLEWPAPEWHRAETLDGLPLCQLGHVLSSAPLSAQELAALPAGAYWLIEGARARAAVPERRVDPSAWLELDGIALRSALRPPRAGAEAAALLPEAPKALRDILGGAIPAASEERAAFLRGARLALRDGTHVARGGVGGAVTGIAAAAGQGLLGVFGAFLGALMPPGAGGHGAGGAGAPRRPAELSGWARRLIDATARLAMLTRVSTLLGWRQAMYMRKMLAMFEQGDVMEALRHAIPLDALGEDARPAFGTPSARAHLTINGPKGSGVIIGIDAQLQQHLRATYRRSFERLDREGKVDEAVYVLAELLKCGAEAVGYLETKERYAQAAQLAETMELDAEMGVRLWVLAGDVARAVRLARTHNAFAGAVRLLEKRNHPQAPALRHEWARHLAARGDHAEAIDVIWPLPDQHALALACMVQAERAGGTLGMRALVRKLALLPGTLDKSVATLDALLGAAGEQGAQMRARLASELLILSPHSEATRKVAALLLRRLIPERMAGLNRLSRKDIDKLVDLSKAALLRADLPNLQFAAVDVVYALAARADVLAMAFDERALMPIHAARALPDGHYLLALGEGGIVRIGAHGKQVAHYPVPAHHLVLAENGQRALALARRDGNYRISRLDLISGKLTDCASMPLLFWGERYDGVTWNVTLDGRLAALDTTVPQLPLLWQIADLPGAIVGFAEGAHYQAILLRAEDKVEQWSYALPGRQMRQRDGWSVPESLWKLLPNAQCGAPYDLRLERADDGVRLHVGGAIFTRPVVIGLGARVDGLAVSIVSDYFLIAVQLDEEAIFSVAQLATGVVKARVTMARSVEPRICMQGDHILMFDQAGRLVDIDISSGALKTLSLS